MDIIAKKMLRGACGMPSKKDALAADMGRRIAARRNQLGLTQAEAAERAGLTQQFFACVETGTKNIRAESIIGVSKALNVSADYLLTGEVTDIDRSRLIKMFESLDTVRFMEMETIIHDILQFGGYNMDT